MFGDLINEQTYNVSCPIAGVHKADSNHETYLVYRMI